MMMMIMMMMVVVMMMVMKGTGRDHRLHNNVKLTAEGPPCGARGSV